LTILRFAHGNSIPQARLRAQGITYQIAQTDTVLHFDNFFRLSQEEKWRNQKVRITLRVPVGQKIHFNENMVNLLYNHEMLDESWGEEMLGKTWVMTATGLVLVEQETVNKDPKDVAGNKEKGTAESKLTVIPHLMRDLVSASPLA
jgi:hypothetical protein